MHYCHYCVLFSVGSSPLKKPAKAKSETTAGSGAGYKSKEFISDNEESSSDSDDKPLKKREPKKESDSEVGEVTVLKFILFFLLLLSSGVLTL